MSTNGNGQAAAREREEEAPELPEAVIRFLSRLARQRFYGKVTISFQAGKPGEVRTEEVKKVSELEGGGTWNRGG